VYSAIQFSKEQETITTENKVTENYFSTSKFMPQLINKKALRIKSSKLVQLVQAGEDFRGQKHMLQVFLHNYEIVNKDTIHTNNF
jgi:hypothetical protein